MLYIQVPDRNDSLSDLSIDGTLYRLRFTYNEKYDYWSFGLYDADRQPISPMTRVVPNFPLLHFCTERALPDGVFGCLSQSEVVGRQAFNDGTAEFVYLPSVELEAPNV